MSGRISCPKLRLRIRTPARGHTISCPKSTKFHVRRTGRRLSGAQDAPRAFSAKNIFRAGDEDAGAACLAPDPVVPSSRRAIIVVPGHEPAVVDPQLAIEKMKFFHVRMRVRGIMRSGRETYQHADPLSFRVIRQELAFDSGRDLFPFRLRPRLYRRDHRRFSRIFRNALCKTRFQRGGRTEHIGRPADQTVEHRAKTLQFLPAIRAARDMALGRRNLRFGKCVSGVGAGGLALLASVGAHDISPFAANASRSLWSPERMRVLTVPSGWFSRAAASAWVKPPKNVTSIASRSPAVRFASAARNDWVCWRSSSTSRGSAVASSVGDRLLPLPLRLMRLSNRSRSIARERA